MEGIDPFISEITIFQKIILCQNFSKKHRKNIFKAKYQNNS